MKPFEVEQRLLNYVLTYGNDAARIVLPGLTLDKFVFSITGQFGMGHGLIWKEITTTYLKKNISPTLELIKGQFNEEEVTYLHNLPKVGQFDSDLIQQLAELVDKQGIIYNVARHGSYLGTAIDSVEQFMLTVDRISDVESWATEQLNTLRLNMSMQSQGYRHISEVTKDLIQEWEDIRAGRRSPIVPCGIPILEQNMLFPAGEIVVMHGLPGSGKSTLVFQANFGTALNLYVNDLPGCVAINSLEMSSNRLVERLTGILAHADIRELKQNAMSDQKYAELRDYAEFVKELPIFIDDTSFLTTTALQYRASGLHVSPHGPVVQLSSDYGELFRTDEGGFNKEERVDKVFREQFLLSRLIGASVIAISQSTNDKAYSGKTYIAGPDGTRYSRGILMTADVLCELWNPEQIEKSGRNIILNDSIPGLTKDHPYLWIQKYRSGEVGEKVPLGWRPQTTTFYDMNLSQTVGKETVYTTLEKAMNKFKGAHSTW